MCVKGAIWSTSAQADSRKILPTLKQQLRVLVVSPLEGQIVNEINCALKLLLQSGERGGTVVDVK